MNDSAQESVPRRARGARSHWALLLLASYGVCAGCATKNGGRPDARLDDAGSSDAGTLYDAGPSDAGALDGSTSDGGRGGAPPSSACWSDEPPLAEVAFWVAPGGDDTGPGTQAAPFATPQRAAEAVRALRASGATAEITVVLRGGTYALTQPWRLGPEDSGSPDARVLWRAYPGERVVLSGATPLAPSWFAPLSTDDPLYARVPASARGRVVVAPLGDHGILDYGSLHRRGMSSTSHWGMELLVNGRPAELAGWPNRGQSDPLDETRPALVRGDIFGASGTEFRPIGRSAAGDADDGYPSYRADVNGTTYYLYHCTWFYGENLNRYWWVTTSDPRTDPKCWPSSQTAWGASGTDPIPRLRPLFGAAQEGLFASNRPEDFTLNGLAWYRVAYSDTEFQLPGTRWQAWLQADDPWFWGLFRHLWADATLPGTIDASGRVTLSEAPNYGLTDMRPFRVLNLIEELDTPGEYYLDRSTGRLYYLPSIDLERAALAVTVADGPLLALDGARHLRFMGITFLGSRGGLVDARDVLDVVFERCELLAAAGEAAHIRGASSGLSCVRILDAGGGGVVLEGGHRATLEAGQSFLRDSEIGFFGRLDRTYHVGVRINGCGQVVEHNTFHDAPHAAILFTGNDHLIAYNEIARVVREAKDAGAIYTGRDWGYRGNVIRYNWIHDIGHTFLGGVHAVYLDDASSGIEVFGNIITKVRGMATLSGGGRDNRFENNVIAHVEGAAHHTDRRARTSNNTFAPDGSPDSWNLLGRLHYDFPTYDRGTRLAYQQEPWASAYPALAAIPDDWTRIQGTHWQDPEGCVFSRNLIFDAEGFIHQGTWGGANGLDTYAEVRDNLQGQDPGFVDEAGGDLRLRPDSPAFSIPGFRPIPFEDIGPR